MFRVWCKNKNEWETDFAVMDQDGRFYFMVNSNLQPINMKNHIVEFSSGVCDKNGVKIYEGDIVNVPYNYIGNQTVVYENGKWSFASFVVSKLEVVGDIHKSI